MLRNAAVARSHAIIGKWAVFVHFSLFMLANDGKSVTINNFDGGGIGDGNHDGSGCFKENSNEKSERKIVQTNTFLGFSRA